MGAAPVRPGAIWRQRLLLVFAATLLSLAVLEAAVRAFGLAPRVEVIARGRFRLSENPALAYEPVPRGEYHGEDLRFYDYREASNSLGYRDREHVRAKPTGTRRIAVLGDSIAAGLRVEHYRNTFPAILETELRRAGLPVEVLNFGVSGYDTRQEVETLRVRALDFAPDLVLLAYCLNDDTDRNGPILDALRAEQGRRGRVLPTAEARLLLRSALYRAVVFDLLRPRLLTGAARAPAEHRVAESFSLLDELAEEHDLSVLVTVFPRFYRLFRYPFENEHSSIRRLAAEHGFLHLDLLPAYRECWPGARRLLSEDTWHPTAYGHRCAAEAMARFILAEVWPPSSTRSAGEGRESTTRAPSAPESRP